MVDAAGIREKERVSTRGDLADGETRSNNELREVSRGHSTIKKNGKDRTIVSPNNGRKEVNMEKAEYLGNEVVLCQEIEQNKMREITQRRGIR